MTRKTNHGAAQQLSFRLPAALVQRVDQCTDEFKAAGMDVTRADVVRLLLNFALDSTECRLDRLFALRQRRRALPRHA